MSLGIKQNGVAIANTILMKEAYKANSLWLFVEGKEDFIGFMGCFDHDVVSIVPSGCKQHVLDAVSHYIANSKSKKLGLGIIDHDYDQILAIKRTIPNVYYIDCHDFLVMAFLSDALESVLVQGNVTEDKILVRDKIFELARMPGILRLLNEKYGWRIELRNYAYQFAELSAAEAATKLLNEKLKGYTLTIDLQKEIEAEQAAAHPRDHLCQGHDVCKLFHITYLAKGGQCGDFLMHAYNAKYFSSTAIYRDLKAFLSSQALERALLTMA